MYWNGKYARVSDNKNTFVHRRKISCLYFNKMNRFLWQNKLCIG